MGLEEIETKLQNALAKYGQVSEDVRDAPISRDDVENIQQTLYEAVNAMKNDRNSNPTVSDNLRQWLIKSSMTVLDPELKSFVKLADIEEISYLLVNQYPTLNDLIYSILFEPDEVSELGLPLGEMQAVMKQHFESQTELIKSLKRRYLSAEVCELCNAFPEIKMLCSTPWKALNEKMDEMLVSEDHKRVVMAFLWSQHSEFRKALCENDFSARVSSSRARIELESKGASRYLEELSKHERLELKERYELTERQLGILDALAASSTFEIANKASDLDKHLERQHFIDLITKAKVALTLVANGCQVQSTELEELCTIFKWDKELLTKSNVIQPMKNMLDQALRILERHEPDEVRTGRSEDLIASVENGSAMYGLCFGLNKDDWCYRAPFPLLLRAEVCNLASPDEPSVCKSFCFSDKEEARKFEKAVIEVGLKAAESFASQCESCFERSSYGYSNSVIILSFQSYPMASFRLGDRDLSLTPQAEEALDEVCDSSV